MTILEGQNPRYRMVCVFDRPWKSASWTKNLAEANLSLRHETAALGRG